MMKGSIKVVPAHQVDRVYKGVRRDRTEGKKLHMLALLPKVTL